MTYEQIECYDDQSSMLLVWVESDRVHSGDTVRFKETGERWWKVGTVYTHTRVEHMNRGWGLDLPKSQRTER